MNKELIFTKAGEDKILPFPDDKLAEKLKTDFDFMVGYYPEGYNTILLLIEDNKEDSRKDKWKIVNFKKIRKLTGTITLDNIDSFDANAENDYEFFKVMECNFEEVITHWANILKKEITKTEVMSKDNG